MFQKDSCQPLTRFSTGFAINNSSLTDVDVFPFEVGIFAENSSKLNLSGTDQTLSGNNTTSLISTDIRTSTHDFTVLVICLMGLVLLGSVGNTVVISSLRKPHLRNPINMVIVNLAVVDLMVCVVLIPMVIINLMADCVSLLCDILGIIGLLIFNYTLHLQCLVLFSNIRVVTTALHRKKKAFTWKWLCFGSLISLILDACISITPTEYGYTSYVPSVGYCYYIYNDEDKVAVAMSMVYIIHFFVVVLLCFVFYFILLRYVKKHSARPDLARQRHVLIFKEMFKKFMFWMLSYTIILITRYVDRKGNWNEILYQLGYFLVWSNSVIRPLIRIFGKLSRKDILPCYGNTVEPIVPRTQTVTQGQPNTTTTTSFNTG